MRNGIKNYRPRDSVTRNQRWFKSLRTRSNNSGLSYDLSSRDFSSKPKLGNTAQGKKNTLREMQAKQNQKW